MRYCPFCGTPLGEGFQFCVSCGSQLPAAPQAPTAPQPVPYATAPTYAPTAVNQPVAPPYAAPAHGPYPTAATARHPLPPSPPIAYEPMASSNPLRVVAEGSWLASLVVPLVGMGVAYGLSVLATVLMGHGRDGVDPSTGTVLWQSVNLMLEAVGVPIGYEYSSTTGSDWAPPLLITFFALAASTAAFALFTRRYARREAAVGVAIRSAIVVMLVGGAVAIAINVADPAVPYAGNPDSFTSGDSTVAAPSLLPSIGWAFLVPPALFLVALVASLLRRRGSYDSASRFHELCHRPLRGIQVLLWATLPVSLIYQFALERSAYGVFKPFDLASWVRSALWSPASGANTYGIGLGGPFGIRFGTEDDIRSDYYGRPARLADLVDPSNDRGAAFDFKDLLWASIPAVIVVVLLVALVVTWRASRLEALRNVGVTAVATLVVIPLLFTASSGFTRQGEDYSSRVGLDLLESTFTLWGALVVASLIAIAFTRREPVPAYARPWDAPNDLTAPAQHDDVEPAPDDATQIAHPEDESTRVVERRSEDESPEPPEEYLPRH